MTREEINYALACNDANAWADYQSTERSILWAERALRKCELTEIPEEDDPFYPMFIEVFGEVMRKALLDDLLRGMTNHGLIDASVTQDGELMYSITEAGEKILESHGAV